MSSNGKQMLHEKSLLLFRVGPFRFCVPATDVEAIIGMPTFRSIPAAPPSIQGVFSHRGQIATIISLRRKFGLQDHRDATDGQLILANISIGLTGFRVDEVMDLATSMEKDIIELSALKQSTRFDQVLVLGDQIIQCTTFEQLYQAEDAPFHPGPTPATDPSSEDVLPPVETKEAPHSDVSAEQTTPTVPENANRISGESGENIAPDISDETTPEVSSPHEKLPGAASFNLGAQFASSVKASPQKKKAPRQFHQQTGRQTTVMKKPGHDIASGKSISRTPHGSTFTGENVGWSPPRKRSGFFIACGVALAIGVIVLYLLWPNATEKHRLQPEPTVPDVSVALEDAKTDAKPLKDATSAISQVLEPEELEDKNESTEASGPQEPSSRFITIDTEKFTLSVEPGLSESVEPAPPSPPASIPETEYVHTVVKGDTLWDIAEEYLGDPFQYPQLAESSHIRDPDWIYPGDRVRIIIKKTPDEGSR